MSCRVLKRGIENFVLNTISICAKENGFTYLKGEYIPIAKNEMVKDHYPNPGFEKQNNYWILSINDYVEKKNYKHKKIDKMETREILKQLNTIFVNVLDNEELVISETTTANDVEEWDSLTHIQLVVTIEKHFKIRFTSKEIQSWSNVGEMAECIYSKIRL